MGQAAYDLLQTGEKHMINRLFLIVIFLCLSSTAHAGFFGSFGDEAGAKKAVLAYVVDPGSTKFGKFDRYDDNNVCIKVNTKNRLGGYTGWQTAFVRKTKGQWKVIGISDVLDPCEIAKYRK